MNSSEYLENHVMTASPHQLHLMVIDGALRFARQGKESLLENDYEMAHLALGQSRDFVNELIGGLNEDEAPELVDQLKSLFAFVLKNLAQADFDHQAEPVEDAISILEKHRQTWVDLAEKIPARPSSAQKHQQSHPQLPETEEGDIRRGDTGHSWTT